VAIVGAGIAGLAAAWELRDKAEVTIYEADRVGGKILTEPFEGRPVECGPDAFITRVPDAIALCAELGLDDLVAPEAGRTLLWWDGRLRELPDGLVLGVPKKLGPLVTSGLLSPAGMARAAADLVLPRRPLGEDISVRDLIAGRFGREVADRLVDPLVGGIHAGRTDELSATATVPQLVAAAKSSRSLLLGLRRAPGPPAGAGTEPLFLTPRAGLAHLVERIATAGPPVTTETVEAVSADGGRWRVVPGDDLFDAVVLAVPARDAARLLGRETGPAGLARIEYASVALVTLGYPEMDLPEATNGILVPRHQGRLMTACSFGSAKWPHWANPGRTVLRVSAGRAGDRRAFELEDEELVERLSTEVAEALGRGDRPDTWRVSRWPDSFPQYRVGHPQTVRSITADLARTHPGVTVCGASYQGAGLPACIASGRAAARTAVAAVLQP
jgi:oxygen-dependent protoporphyrinogen oxidase